MLVTEQVQAQVIYELRHEFNVVDLVKAADIPRSTYYSEKGDEVKREKSVEYEIIHSLCSVISQSKECIAERTLSFDSFTEVSGKPTMTMDSFPSTTWT